MEEVNKIAPAFNRLYKEFILFMSQDKPLPRAGKGMVMCKAALFILKRSRRSTFPLSHANFELNIPKKKDMRKWDLRSIVNVDNVIPPASWSLKDVESWLISQLAEIQSSSSGKKPVSATADLYDNRCLERHSVTESNSSRARKARNQVFIDYGGCELL